ncbi:PASTA domain-containing protein [uncultured Microbacterium sp.]|uniref:PASTA domain-containing protein n=1 Tax=uncultured Microbacterium sp. TaxID=191216 RepID=UPI002631A43F|nr:PASTA domain-containing protein [uncultured Microbacterium sp.]
MNTPAQDRPRRRFTRASLTAIIAVSALLAACTPSPLDALPTPEAETVALPDVIGMRGDIAQEQLRELGMLVTLRADEASVWEPANWIVEEQDPVAGAVKLRSSVTLHVGRPPAEPWDGLTDGTWEGGDFTLGESVLPPVAGLTGNMRWDWEFIVTGPPTLTTTDGGERITMSSPLTVTRIQNAWPDEQFQDDMQFIFRPGEVPEHAKMNESWGVHTDIECTQETLQLNEATTCLVSFVAEPEAIANSYWRVNRTFDVAAWPGQLRQ